MDKTRIDKWLWAARFFKTRSLATDAVNRGHVQVSQQDIKPSREVRLGDMLTIWQAKVPHTVVVKGISEQRGPAPVAQQLYAETPESVQLRTLAAESRRLSPEPALSMEHGRPTKRDRRDLEKGWNDRWSASIDR
jgi:ribosome-associated heat shock protein Hsp15